ncbi:MAG: antitoxin VapB family protein [Candidatus Micrarchaeota archaeon]|nr:antitoxin VapB family protein [Candidatus Micrarchaeota archaeon]
MTKLISVTDDVYAALSKLKLPGESFSKLFARLSIRRVKQKTIMDYAGALRDSPELDRVFAEILVRRHAAQRKPVRL